MVRSTLLPLMRVQPIVLEVRWALVEPVLCLRHTDQRGTASARSQLPRVPK